VSAVMSRSIRTTCAIRAPDTEPTLDEFQARLELAMRGGMILCALGFTREVLHALDAVRDAAPNPPRQLLDAAMDAYVRQVMDSRPWWQQSTWW
jgi:hypothetical protein